MRLSVVVLTVLTSISCRTTLPSSDGAVRFAGASSGAARPSLIVVLTVDQLRPDYLDIYRDQLTGGLGRLLKGGAVFRNASLDHAITETAPGHASILSGRFPRSTNIGANNDGVLDPSYPLVLGAGEPASPARFRGTSLGDWLTQRNPATRLLSVSRKDRAAILPLGRARCCAYWYAVGGPFTTSTYYADTLPGWLRDFNARQLPRRYAGHAWRPLLAASEYREADSVSVEGGGVDFVFPHQLSDDSARTARLLPMYPMMDEVTFHLALAGLTANALGAARDRTDLLAISLSSTDAIGHRYGPDSREVHDQILRLDRSLGAFFDSLYTLRDSSRVVVVLTADHGVGPHPDIPSRYRTAAGGFADIRPVAATVRRALVQAGVDSSGFRYDGDVLFLDPEAFRRAGVNRDSVARVYAKGVARREGVLRADVYDDLLKAPPSADPITRRWQHMFDAAKGVAVVVTLKPFWFWADGANIGRHGSPHAYDASVPLIFAGAGIRPGRYREFVRVVDIAPTLAALAGVTPTESLDGVVLRRALAPSSR